MLDTRRYLRHIIDTKERIHIHSNIKKFIISLLFALAIAFIPEYSDLSIDANLTLFILLFAAGLWISEAIPAFAVSLLIIALEMILLGFHGFAYREENPEWKIYLQPWSSPLVFLFFAGFVMAAAATKTKLDLWMAKKVLFFSGDNPKNILTGMMVITFCLSMFMSNTATTAMMIAVLIPLVASMKEDNPFKIALLLAVTISANIGGMGTIIGTPPNAIAVGTLGSDAPHFIEWMLLAVPPALVMIFMMRYLLLFLYPSNEEKIDLKGIENVEHYDDSTTIHTKIPTTPSWKKMVVITVFLVTVFLWLSEPIHHIPTTVVSLLPVVAFTIFGIIDVDDIRSLNWDVLILIVGGLALGIAVSNTGLASWFASSIPLDGLGLFLSVLIFGYVVVVVSNFMSNTAATNIMLPIVIAFVAIVDGEATKFAAVAIAMSASFAMCLPVSTPPNAIVYASGKLKSKHFLIVGIFAATLGPLISISWLSLF